MIAALVMLTWLAQDDGPAAAIAQPTFTSRSSLQGQQVAPAPAPIGKGNISGVVVDGKTGEPVRKAQVTLFGQATMPPPQPEASAGPAQPAVFQPMSPINLTVVTDGSGTFAFHALPAGNFTITAQHENYTQRMGAQMASAVTLNEDQDHPNVRLKLMPGGVIEGHVVDEDGLGVPRCQIQARGKTASQPGNNGFFQMGANSDDQGFYRVHNLQPGRYELRVQCNQQFPRPHGFMHMNDPLIPHEGYAAADYGAGDPSKSGGLLVTAGSNLTAIDFHLHREPFYVIRAHVDLPDGGQANGYNVELIPKNSPMGEEFPYRPTHMRGGGGFTFNHIPAGTYELVASNFAPDHAWIARTTLEAGKVDVLDVELKPEAGPKVSGQITTDNPEQALDGMQIMLAPNSQGYRGPWPSGKVDKDGNFTLDNMMPGRFRVNPTLPGFVKSISVGGQPVNPADFELAAGSGPIRIALGTKFGELDLDAPAPPQGQNLAAVLLPPDVSQPFMQPLTISSTDGHIRWQGIAPGKYRLYLLQSVNPWIAANDLELMGKLSGSSAQVEIEEGQTTHGTAPKVISGEDLEHALEASE